MPTRDVTVNLENKVENALHDLIKENVSEIFFLPRFAFLTVWGQQSFFHGPQIRRLQNLWFTDWQIWVNFRTFLVWNENPKHLV